MVDSIYVGIVRWIFKANIQKLSLCTKSKQLKATSLSLEDIILCTTSNSNLNLETLMSCFNMTSLLCIKPEPQIKVFPVLCG